MADRTVVVCDALRAVAEAVAGYLAAAPELTVVATATTPEDALEAAMEHRPALVVLDVAVARGHPRGLVAALVGASDCRVLMTGAVATPGEAAEALRDGVHGWLAESSSASEMLGAARAVLRGEFHFPPELVVGALRTVAQAATPPAEPSADARMSALGERERAVLACLVEGLDRRGIAVRLGIAENTAKTHIGRILTKLGAHSMLEAAAIGRRAGVAGASQPE